MNEPCAVKTVIPIMVQMIAKLTAREGNFFSIKLLKIGTNTTVRLKMKPAFETEVDCKPNKLNANTMNNKNP